MTGDCTQEDNDTTPLPLVTDVPLLPGLYLVATPVGNLRDITLRALDVLKSVDLIACEDTRVSRVLLQRYGIDRPVFAYHDHNADRQRPVLLDHLAAGKRLALISDAGTPLIADPGYKLVRDAVAAGFMVTALPGANAVLTAVQLSALPSDRFCFLGFLPPKSGARRTALAEYASWPLTLVFYEGVSRLPDTLVDMAAMLGPDRPAAVLRELTKLYEEGRRGTLAELADYYQEQGPPRGEIVIVVGPPVVGAADIKADTVDQLLKKALAETSMRDAVDQVTTLTGLPRKQIYQRALEMRALDIRDEGGE